MRRDLRHLLISVLCLAFLSQSVVLAQAGRIEAGTITSPALEGNLVGDSPTRPFYIYLPPSYDTSEDEYPVYYLLHGYTGAANSMTPIGPIMNDMIRSGQIQEMIVVLPDGSNKFDGSNYLSSPTIGDYETYIASDLVDHVDANYRTIADRRSRGITGFSMGGFGTMHLALKFPDVFSVAVAQGGFYSVDADWFRIPAMAAARMEPRDFRELTNIGFMVRGTFAYTAATSSNPDGPPFYISRPFEVVDDEPEIVPEAWEKLVESDVLNGDLPRYLNQNTRLAAIKLIHGAGDGTIPVSEARNLSAALTEAGIEHTYMEHTGGHDFLPEESLLFLSEHLTTEPQPVSTSVQPFGKLTTVWGAMKNEQ